MNRIVSFATYPSLSGRVVLVTGGASGIGADIVRAFSANGAKVGFFDIQMDAGRRLAEDLSGSAHAPLFLKCDLAEITALRESVAEVKRRLGPVAVLVNNAANDDRHRIDEVTPDYWDWSQHVNLRPHFFTSQAVHPHMVELGYGSIINFSSIVWRRGAGQMVAYAAAKAGVVGLTRALAQAFGGDNIRVNAIEPGAVITDRQRELWYKTPESIDVMVERQAIKKILLGEEIARTALFLAADDSRMITKQSITVDAGLR